MAKQFQRTHSETELTNYLKQGAPPATDKTWAAVSVVSQNVSTDMSTMTDLSKVSGAERQALRLDIYLLGESIGKALKAKTPGRHGQGAGCHAEDDQERCGKSHEVHPDLGEDHGRLRARLRHDGRLEAHRGDGREKIGKAHLTYAQGASAELMAAATIGLADGLGLPVSTTHVLSSGIAARWSRTGSGVQKETLISILMAWVLTLPVCIFLGATLFSAALYVTFHVFGIQ